MDAVGGEERRVGLVWGERVGVDLHQAGAVQSFKCALRLNPELLDGYYSLGLTLKQQAAAQRRPRKSPPTPPPNAQAKEHYERGLELLAKEDAAGAREALEKAVLVDPRYAEAHNRLGFVLGRLGDLEMALVHLDRAVELQLTPIR